MPTITIHTASYNRAYILGKAYESLREQTCKDFEWIISDDGSSDNTEELVKGWQKEDNGFEIIYSKLPHVGFPRALNDGIRLSNTDWFMMLDSDDYLMPETIETIIPWIKEVEGMDMMAGIGVTRCFPDGKFMKNKMPKIDADLGYIDASNSDRAKYNLNMDKEDKN